MSNLLDKNIAVAEHVRRKSEDRMAKEVCQNSILGVSGRERPLM